MEENRTKVLIYHPADIIANLVDTLITQSEYGEQIETLIPEGRLSHPEKLQWALQTLHEKAPSLLVSTITYLPDIAGHQGDMGIVLLDSAVDINTPRHEELRQRHIEIVHFQMGLNPQDMVRRIAQKALRT